MTLPDWLPSPVKINLFLHVTGRREDGYHLLQTLFQFLDYGDQIAVETNNAGEISRADHHRFDLPQQDLCIAAAKRLRDHAGNADLGAKIHLNKKIQPGTGLGAGSSNAATVLLALDRAWKLDLEEKTLLDIATDLGADVPVFVHGRATWAEGVGDQMKAASPAVGLTCVVIPDVAVATAEAFGAPELVRDHLPVNFRDFTDGYTINDLEPVVCARYPEVAKTLDWLRQFGEARMSGTGSSLFVDVEDEEAGLAILNDLPPGASGFVAARTNWSPLHRLLARSTPID